MNCGEDKILQNNKKNIIVSFLKYISNIFIDAIIIANITIPFLYFNFHMSAEDLFKSSMVFIVIFLAYALVHWFKVAKNKV